MRKIYVVGSSNKSLDGYARWMQGTVAKSIEEADLVVFTGGEDVHPDFYGEPMHPQTYANHTRDRYEMAKFTEAFKLGKHMIGICRGSQFLCVANGGHLVQHQQNPKFIHKITTYDGLELYITSTHHQAAYPFNLPKENYEVLAWTNNISAFHENGNQEELNPPVECEIVHYPKGLCLGIQGHPEMLELTHPTIAYLRNLLNGFMQTNINITSNGKKEDTADEVQAENSVETQNA